MRKILILILLLGFLLPLQTYAGSYGYLKGKVLDSEGQPVIGASVLVEGTTRGTYVKDKNGSYSIANISPGSYTVIVRGVGFAEYRVKVTISADVTTEINVKLQSKSVMKKDIDVVANKVMVNNDNIGSIKTMQRDQITSTGREGVQSIVSLSAGVINSGGGYNVRGSRASETQVRVDGFDFSNQFSGGAATGGYAPMVSAYATEEVQVITGGFSAEYGNALGGVVNTNVKTGKTNTYEGFLRWRSPFSTFNGSQTSGIKAQRIGDKVKVFEAGDGVKVLSGNDQTIELGGGGPIPFLDNSTFFLSSKYIQRSKAGGYEIYDPLGGPIFNRPDQGVWVKNITGRLTFALTQDIKLTVGSSYGLTSSESSGWSWLYANDFGVFYDTLDNGDIQKRYNNIPERVAKQGSGNQLIANGFIRINHALSNSSFYELNVSTTANNDEGARKANFDGPNFFTGFDLLTPQDKYQISQDGSSLSPGSNKAVDQYEFLTKIQYTEDHYLLKDLPTINPLTGYYEGQANSNGTNNPYGLANMGFATHGSGGFSYRKGQYYQIDGSYTNMFKDGEFDHILKTGFEVRFNEMRLHYNGNPWDSNPFYDVYSDEWGGNLYADNQKTYDKTSKPYKPWRWSAYVIDQIKYKGIIFSPSMRIDFFDPNAIYRLPSLNFTPISSDTGFAKTDIKIQVSPRINVTYPLTEQSNVSISYGLYFQMPELQTLYDAFNTDRLRGNALLGDPNMKVQRTNEYQVSYSNALSDDFSISLEAYYRDVYNQLGIKYISTIPDPYFQYTVSDYGNAKGLELALRKRATNHIGFDFNYTLSFAEGISASPADNYNPPVDPFTNKQAFPIAAYPLPWDQRHGINLVLDIVWGNNEGPAIGDIQLLENTRFNLTSNYHSGRPYTKVDKGQNPISEVNSERQPDAYGADFKVTKQFYLRDFGLGDESSNASIEFSLDIYNVFNIRRALSVYSATGDPDDDGISLYRNIGSFSPVTYHKEANYGMAETFFTDQYDMYGKRMYSPNADFDRNGMVTQVENFQSYMNYIQTLMLFRGLYQGPRTCAFSVLFRF